jgi:hypothetical protein
MKLLDINHILNLIGNNYYPIYIYNININIFIIWELIINIDNYNSSLLFI